MKVLFIKNKGANQKKINDDKKMLVDYYKTKFPKAHGINKLDITVDEIESDILVTLKYAGMTSEGRRAFCTLDSKQLIREKGIVPEGEYQVVYFYYDSSSLVIPAKQKTDYIAPLTFHNPLYPNTEYIEMPSSYEKNAVIHEMVHAIGNILERQEIKVLDEMDRSFVEGLWKPYYKNSFPLIDGGNYDITLSRYSPYFDKLIVTKEVPQVQLTPSLVSYNGVKLPGTFKGNLYIPKHFKLQELVPANIFNTFGETAWQFLDKRMLMNLDFIRNTLGLAVNVNGKQFNYRGYDDGGYRTNQSQHRFGRAVDFDVVGMTAQQFREWIKLNYQKLPEPNVWIEDEVTWVHMDVRYSDKLGLYLFKV